MAKLGSLVGTSVLILDNHRSHVSKHIGEYCLKAGLELLYLPPYGSELNPIELVWSHFKRIWGQLVYKKCLDPNIKKPNYSQEAIKKIVLEAL